MGYAEDAMRELNGDRITDNMPPTVQAAYAKESAISIGVRQIFFDVSKELDQARATHAPMNSHHEGYAVILEELDELWEVCKANTHSLAHDVPKWAIGFDFDTSDKASLRRLKRAAMRKEAIQVAAMAIRFVEDICDEGATK